MFDKKQQQYYLIISTGNHSQQQIHTLLITSIGEQGVVTVYTFLIGKNIKVVTCENRFDKVERSSIYGLTGLRNRG